MYSVRYIPNSGKFQVGITVNYAAPETVEVLSTIADYNAAKRFELILNLVIQPEHRELFAYELQSFYTDMLAEALNK